METYKELTLDTLDWKTANTPGNIHALTQGQTNKLHIRHAGKKFQKQCTVTLTAVNKPLQEFMQELILLQLQVDDAVITVRSEAVGGGHGHYDYATVIKVTGWFDLTGEQVEGVKELQKLNKARDAREREARKLEKQAAMLRRV